MTNIIKKPINIFNDTFAFTCQKFFYQHQIK